MMMLWNIDIFVDQLEMKEKEVISVDLVGVEKEADLCVLFKVTIEKFCNHTKL